MLPRIGGLLTTAPPRCTQAVFEKMMQLLDQSVDVNLSVTGVLSALIVYPDPNLHRTLFAPLYAPVTGDTGSESGGVARNVPSMMAAVRPWCSACFPPLRLTTASLGTAVAPGVVSWRKVGGLRCASTRRTTRAVSGE